jgi:CheY-like chemotaxis protein
VYLPRALGKSASAREAKNPSGSVHGSATILVVDDDAQVREVAVNCLQGLGYRMIAAENGPSALKILARGTQVDLLLADMAMPGMNGVELIKKARERNPGLLAMLVTGYAETGSFSPAEGDFVLQKPYRLERLAEAVAAVLRREKPSNVVAMKPPRRA